MNPARRRAERRGRHGEAIAAWWLRLHGWRIVAARVRTPAGEIDLLARRGGVLAAVEVKTRAANDHLNLAVDRHRLARVAAAARRIAATRLRPGESFRIDIVLVAPWRLPRHLENVWHD